MKILIANVNDGIREYNYTSWEIDKYKLLDKLHDIKQNGEEILKGDIIPIEQADGDSIFYKMAKRMIDYEDGEIKIIYWFK